MALKTETDTKRFEKKTKADTDKTTSLKEGNRTQRNRGKRGGEAASY